MPIYEYKCDKCGVFEVMGRITDGPLKKCPTCKGKVERIISHTSFVLKGSGWYATDYAGAGKKTESSSDTSSTANGTASSGNGSAASDSKASSEASKPAASAKPSADKSASSGTDKASSKASD